MSLEDNITREALGGTQKHERRPPRNHSSRVDVRYALRFLDLLALIFEKSGLSMEATGGSGSNASD